MFASRPFSAWRGGRQLDCASSSLSDLRTNLEQLAIFCQKCPRFRNHMLARGHSLEEYCENILSPIGCQPRRLWAKLFSQGFSAAFDLGQQDCGARRLALRCGAGWVHVVRHRSTGTQRQPARQECDLRSANDCVFQNFGIQLPPARNCPMPFRPNPDPNARWRRGAGSASAAAHSAATRRSRRGAPSPLSLANP